MMIDDLKELDARIAAILPRYLEALQILEAKKRRKEGYWYSGIPGFFHVPEDDQSSEN